MSGIEVTGLTKYYGRVPAVSELSFSVRPGRVTGFLGPNGAGKSTTMRAMVGLDHADAGEVRIDGKRYRDLKTPFRHVGALLDARWTHPHRSAQAHLRWLAAANGISRRRVHKVLDSVGLTEVRRRRAGGFSLGMTQRLGIAGALLGDPTALVLDEPVNGLDPEGIRWLRQLLRRLAAEGRTVFVSSHVLSEMVQTADDLVVIGKGRLVAQCTTDEFVNRATEAAVRVRGTHLDRLHAALRRRRLDAEPTDGALIVNGTRPEHVGQIAADEGVVLHELVEQRGSLEQAFLRLTQDAVDYRGEALA